MLTKSQQTARRGKIGGSLTPAILGLDRYCSPLKAYLILRGELTDDGAKGEDAEFGSAFETGILQVAMPRLRDRLRNQDIGLVQPYDTRANPRWPWLVGSYDGLLEGYPAGIEAKNRDRFLRDRYGDPWSDAVMDSEIIQCQQYMLISGLPEWFLAVAFGGNRLAIFHLHTNPDLQGIIIQRTRAFMDRVESGTPPPPATDTDLDLLYAREHGTLRVATSEERALCERFRHTRERVKAAEEEKDHLAFRIKELIGEDAGLIDAQGKALVTWKAPKDASRFDLARFRTEHPALAAKFTTLSPSTRRLLVR
jgi:predicted phage-related endonuclease